MQGFTLLNEALDGFVTGNTAILSERPSEEPEENGELPPHHSRVLHRHRKVKTPKPSTATKPNDGNGCGLRT